MKKEKKQKYVLGDLIVALSEEAEKMTFQRSEREFLVCTALKHLLMRQVRTTHPIVLQ